MALTRPVAYGERGMVATPHYLASAAALDALKEGGTAVDAALSAVATLGAVLPHMTGIGGDAFWLIYDAKTGTLAGINGSGTAGRRASLDAYRGSDAIPERGPRSAITVPGTVDSWRLAHGRFGRLPLSRLLAPAIHYARAGTPVTAGLAAWTAESAAALREDAGAAAIFLPGDEPLQERARLMQPQLAHTLAQIAEAGPRYFYESTGVSVARYLAGRGGLLCPEDFAGYAARWVQPISVRYRDCTAFQLPPPSQGLAGLLILNFLAGVDVAALGDASTGYFNALVQAIKWAFRQRDAWLTDPDFLDIPLARLLDPATADRDRVAAMADVAASPAGRGTKGDTVFVATADAEGNAVGVVESLYFDFGAAVLDPDSGVLLQNRGSYFSLDAAHPNVLAPGKQSASTLMAGMLFRDGRPYLVHGTQGGEVQPQTNAALVSRVVDFGRNAQEAIEALRLLHGRSWGDSANQLLVETRGDDAAIAGLARLGHPAQAVAWPHPRMGTAQAIRLDFAREAFFEGGADPRGEGLALGY
ncbi:MAG TPA: gamma-glutamyltransferase [Stellaceae bacterium]|nr:gamma-glutamyltransferase [Stellaceae bacterium]